MKRHCLTARIDISQSPMMSASFSKITGDALSGRKRDHMPLRPKGEGRGLMVSGFVTPGGPLEVPAIISDEALRELGIQRTSDKFIPAAKGSYGDGTSMGQHVAKVKQMFPFVFGHRKYELLWIFDNATNHIGIAKDALAADKMNLGPGGKQPVMRDDWNPVTNAPQPINYPDKSNPQEIESFLTLLANSVSAGRLPNIERDRAQGFERFYRDYLADSPSFSR
ncbi:hypothetical protein K470DRAFT_5994 [Piedraia hortae CBS 480.64]|uniref:Uncharacterized protein n=1 Tax=Piedraia hortae CBS 480.64 TaxID=1314780 RepID=A0A6A7CAL3_9PEZI|nr:hypothetical protein K470DRAFT_5994 [Piedraia hortae CBS 480.64]